MSIDRCEFLESVFGVEHPVALVTGSGADRVGRSVARRLVENGYRVVLHAHHSVAEAEATCAAWKMEGFNVSHVSGAVEDESAIAGWIKRILADYGGLHLLVNSAAIWESTPFDTLNSEGLLQQWRTNLLGPALLCRAAGLAMVGQPQGGAIVNIGDWATVRPYTDFAAYLLSKGAVKNLTEIMAVELAQRHSAIRVNAILPGPVKSSNNRCSSARELPKTLRPPFNSLPKAPL
jgi:pteridine reductase